jgi:hypothetical protein
MNTAKRKAAPMSLDKQIKALAETELVNLMDAGSKALNKVCQGSPIGVGQLARLVSDHKPKSTRDACVKILSEKIGKNALASLGNKEPGADKK